MTETQTKFRDGPLTGLRVLDLSRILAGPTAAQLLGDLGADVIKIERPGAGDDTRRWGPPFVKDADGNDTAESAYYLCANRNKRSVTVDMATEAGQALLQDIAAQSDILIENFKVGDLKRRGLDYETLSRRHPGLIYCSITGFGQTGPYASRAGYDFLIQGMGGIMSITGEPDGPPTKVGVGITDVMTGMYAVVSILSALRVRDATGAGQHIDLALLDTQISWLINQGLDYLTAGLTPVRRGNAHPTVVPYETFPASDGWFIIAIGNDGQFRRFMEEAGRADLAADPRFATNPARVANHDELIRLMHEITRTRTEAEWMEALSAVGVPTGPVNDIPAAINDPQALSRGSRVKQPHAKAGKGYVETLGNPVKLSATPVTYRRPPPMVGEHTEEVLAELGFDAAEIRGKGALG
ncbi:CaiB/BaiF CoA-transferase family protein [Pikeienuella sp. HZG-20]|uniref:CaiB/BaiF CoA transferase family protein n=1 Tax=Paludibacillus litoralis TaxID=3133267 RepID=UPI0030EBA0BF